MPHGLKTEHGAFDQLGRRLQLARVLAHLGELNEGVDMIRMVLEQLRDRVRIAALHALKVLQHDAAHAHNTNGVSDRSSHSLKGQRQIEAASPTCSMIFLYWPDHWMPK
jgi:hypothetical protein